MEMNMSSPPQNRQTPLRYAGEEIDIEFLGYITHDASDGLDILNVVSFKPTSEEDIKTTADYDRGLGSKNGKKPSTMNSMMRIWTRRTLTSPSSTMTI